MAPKTLISAEEYLRTPYNSPEPDFVDGEVLPRAVPNTFHSEAVDALIELCIRQAPEALFRRPELRIRVTPDRYRVVDLALFDYKPHQAVPEVNPLVVVEVLSPDDSFADLMSRFEDYAALGIPHIWLVDPIARRLSIYRAESLTATPRFELPSHGLIIRQRDLFRN